MKEFSLVHRLHDLTEYPDADAESLGNPVNADHFTFTAQFQFDVPCDKVDAEVNARADFTLLVLQYVEAGGADVFCNPSHTLDCC